MKKNKSLQPINIDFIRSQCINMLLKYFGITKLISNFILINLVFN